MRNLFYIFLLCFSVLAVSAQEEAEKPFAVIRKTGDPVQPKQDMPKTWQEKTHLGGNVALQFWGSLFVEASPMVGYELNKSGSLVGGVGASYMYYGNSIGSIYGGRVFLRQNIYRGVFAHAEIEQINAQRQMFFGSYATTEASKRVWGGSPLIGGGFYQGSGGRTSSG